MELMFQLAPTKPRFRALCIDFSKIARGELPADTLLAYSMG